MNTALALDTLDHIRAHPEEWNQEHWGYCFAGHVCRQAGLEVISNGPVDRSFSSAYVETDGIKVRTDEVALGLLGVSECAGRELFFASNSIERLTRVVAEKIAAQASTEQLAHEDVPAVA